MPILDAIISLPIDVIDKVTIDTSTCTHPAGHCYGSDGGSGIPANLQVVAGRGGQKQVWTLSADKTKVEKKEVYNQCQYCLKYSYERDEE